MTTANDFLNAFMPPLIPSQDALPALPYAEHLIAGSAMPMLPHQAAVLFTAPALRDLPPITSVFRRAYTTLTQG